MKNINTEEITDRYFNHKHSLELIAKDYDCSVWKIRDVVSKQGVVRPKHSSVCNHEIFKNIDNEEKAYWLGFLAADGCIYSGDGKNTVNITLNSDDRSHVERFKRFVGSSNKIREAKTKGYSLGKTHVTLSFSSLSVVQDLSKFGIIPRKSLIENHEFILDQIPLSFLRHYWRGMVDGDGYIHITSRPQFSIGLVGTEKTMLQFKDFCSTITPIKSNVRKHYSIYQIRFSSNPGLKVAKHLYENSSIYLDRKKTKLEDYETLCSRVD